MPQIWFASEFAHQGAWREEWSSLTHCGKGVSRRYAAWDKKRFFLDEQRQRLSELRQYSKGRMLLAAWREGSAVSGFPLPLAMAGLPDPRRMIENLVGPARRSVGARLWTGDLDLAAYSNNWDISREYIPSRCCAYCYRRFATMPFIEDEWHVFFTCPLYADLRTRLPFRGEDVVVEGFVTQGDGCTPRNLQALARAILNTPNYDKVVDFLMQVMKRRRQNRHITIQGVVSDAVPIL